MSSLYLFFRCHLSRVFITIFISTFLNTAFTYAQLSGSYTVGSGGNYNTLAEAADALRTQGVNGAVTFNVLSGSYNEQIYLNDIDGVSQANTIVFQSQTDNAADVEIYFQQENSSNYIVYLDSTDNISFKNLTFTSSGTAYGRIFILDNGVNHFQLSGCVLNGVNTTSSSVNLAMIYSDGNPLRNENKTISNNTFNYGSYGLWLSGYNASNLSSGTVIESNVFSNNYGGMYVSYQSDLKIRNNEMTGISSYGLNLSYCDNELEITKNKMQVNNSYGIYMTNSDGGTPPVTQRALIANNFIAVGSNSANGIYSYSNTNLDIYHNSINIYASSGTSGRALYLYSGSGINVVNNILSAPSGAYAYYANNAGIATSDYNNLYSPGRYLGYWGGDRKSLSDIQSASGKDAHSLDVYPHFINDSDLHTTAPWLNNKGTSLSEVSDDMDGDARGSSPDIGADEFTPDPGTTTPMVGSYTVGSGGDYADLSAAVSALLLKGVSGPVTLQLLNGTQMGQVFMRDIAGATSSKTVSITSQSGNADDAGLFYAATGSGDNYVLYLYGAEHIRLENLSLSANNSNSSNYGRVVVLWGSADSLEIMGCKLNGSPVSSSSSNLAILYGDGLFSRSMQINGNEFNSGSYGLWLSGYNASNLSSGTVIESNVFSNNYGGMYVSYQSDLKIRNNEMTGISSYGLNLSYCDNELEITKNKMQVNNSYGIYMTNSDGGTPPVTQRALIANNFIAVGSNSANGIYSYSNTNLDIYHNSINIYASSGTSGRALYLYSGSGINVVNNILSAPSGAYAYYANNAGIDTSDYNDLYSPGANLANWGGDVADLAALQATSGKDVNSLSVNPHFKTDSDLHINTVELDSTGTPLAQITTDIDNDPRDPDFPDIGADEYDGNALYIDDSDKISNAPLVFELRQNFPNPFNPVTTIRYQIAREGKVTLIIYNSIGQVVRELVNERQRPGRYEVRFDGAGLSSGMYFYRIQTSTGFKEIRKMILLK